MSRYGKLNELTRFGWENPEQMRAYLERTLRAADGSPSAAARAIDISRPYFHYLLNKYGLRGLPKQVRMEVRAAVTFPTLEECEKASAA